MPQWDDGNQFWYSAYGIVFYGVFRGSGWPSCSYWMVPGMDSD